MAAPERPRVLVLGSLHLDIMVAAPDRPRRGETVTGERWWQVCGGKGRNQAVAAARHGASVAMVGAVGDDAFGTRMRADLAAHGVDAAAVTVLVGQGSGMSVAILDASGDYGAVIVSGANLQVNARLAVPAMADAAWLVLQNEVPDAANIAAALAARAAGAKVLLNAAPARALRAELRGLLDVLVVNAGEAEALGGPEVLHAWAATLIVTRGGDGVDVHDGSGAWHLDAVPVTVASTHGAGDMFVGALVAHLAAGTDLRAAIGLANRAAAALVAGSA